MSIQQHTQLRQIAKNLYLKGRTIKEIADELCISPQIVSAWSREEKWKNTQEVNIIPKTLTVPIPDGLDPLEVAFFENLNTCLTEIHKYLQVMQPRNYERLLELSLEVYKLQMLLAGKATSRVETRVVSDVVNNIVHILQIHIKDQQTLTQVISDIKKLARGEEIGAGFVSNN